MDNLTHSLAGAVLGQMGLKRRTGLAMPALIIGANLPDIDAVAALLGPEALAIRRGITHGPIALAVLPLLLTAALLAYAKWRPNPKRLPIDRGWLLALAYLGTLSHPALDWLNSYGIRLLEPFSSRWFAGDTLFIIDVWLWAALIAGVWLSRKRERAGRSDWRTPAVASFATICAYIAANGLMTGRAEALTAELVQQRHAAPASLVVASPVPVEFWRREMVWRDASDHGGGSYVLGQGATLSAGRTANGIDHPLVEVARRQDPRARAFLFWARMPIARIAGEELILTDQRYDATLAHANFEVRVPLRSLRP